MGGPRCDRRHASRCVAAGVAIATSGCSFTVGVMGGYRRPQSLPATGDAPCEHREAPILDTVLGGTLLLGAVAVAGALALGGALASADGPHQGDSTLPAIVAVGLVASLPSVVFFGSAYYGSRSNAACRALPRESVEPTETAAFFCATSPADHYLCFCSHVAAECEERRTSLAAMGAVIDPCKPSVEDACTHPP